MQCLWQRARCCASGGSRHRGLTTEDVRALKSELSDPRFQDRFWKNEIKLQLSLGTKSEQQALAKYGLDYVTETYLPEKLAELGVTKK